VQGAERQVAGRHIVDHHAEPVDIEHLREGQVLVLHLAEDRIQALLAPEDLGPQAGMHQLVANAVEDAGKQFLAVAARGIQGFGQDLGAMRVNQPEGQVLQLAIKLVEPQAQGNRRVDFQGLAGNAGALVGAHRRHGLQVVLTVSQLD